MFILLFFIPTVLLISTSGTSATLYNSTDPIVQLNSTNFRSTINNKSHASIVEFYNSWCGHCINFAPVWRTFAIDIKGWKNVMTVAAVDCSEDVNTALCRDYSVKYFPTIKFFKPHSQSTDFGIIKDNLNGLATAQAFRHAVVKFLDEIEWPDLNVTKASSIEELKASISTSVDDVIIIVEKENSYLGREIKLDLYDYGENVQVVRISDENNVKNDLNVTKVPFVGVFTPNLNLKTIIHVSPTTHTNVFGAIKESLGLTPIDSSEGGNIFSLPEQTVTTDKSHLMPIAAPVQVYMIDLENSLAHTLFNEIGLHKSINGTDLQVLKSFIKILHQYFPGRLPVTNFLSKLNDWMENLTHFTIQGFHQFYNQIQSSDIYLPLNQDWVTCKGSRQGLRGYPCSLWILFHTITVSAYNSRPSEQGAEFGLTVSQTIADYVKHFFSCTECATHFQTMSATLANDITEPEDMVLWFWKAHNIVNARLASDASEDPQHPKVQFPTAALCGDCKKSDKDWDESNVMTFLVGWYSSINMTGVSTYVTNDSHQSMQLLDLKVIEEPIAVKVDERSSNWSFSTLDMSLCLSLYVCSALILLSVYFIIIVKRRMKKRHQKFPFPFV